MPGFKHHRRIRYMINRYAFMEGGQGAKRRKLVIEKVEMI